MDHEDGDGDGAGLGGGVDGDSGGGMEKKETSPAGLRRSFPPKICILLVSVSCFSRVEALYIGVFRSRGCFRAKDRRKRGHEG